MFEERGFVNGAVGTVHRVLNRFTFVLKLSGGGMVLVHPVSADGLDGLFLPCVYGYATTIRRAQGATFEYGCLYFDHAYPPERGYGYVGVSRFKTRQGVFHFGKFRRSDWLPVGGPGEPTEQVHRGAESDVTPPGSDDDSADEANRAGRGVDAGLVSLRAGYGCDSAEDEEDVRSCTGSCGYDTDFDKDIGRAQGGGWESEESEGEHDSMCGDSEASEDDDVVAGQDSDSDDVSSTWSISSGVRDAMPVSEECVSTQRAFWFACIVVVRACS